MTTTEELTHLAGRVTVAEAEAAMARAERDAAIANAAAEGILQRDIVKATSLTREHIRRIVKAAAEKS